ncbi:MAG TPA: hypothetical protein VGK38_06895 [Prolixibacteraceae bacterium]|jgi:hypothetical protein
MTQNILVYLIIAVTLAYVVFSFLNGLRTKKASQSHCGGCTGCSIKNEISNHAREKQGC